MRQFITPKGLGHGSVLMDELGDPVGTPENPFTVEDHSDRVADGLVLGAKAYNIDGYLPLTAFTTTLTDLNEAGNIIIPIPSSAIQMRVRSTSVNDVNITGSGIWTVEIYGLDGNYDEISEVIALNGLTPVTTVNSYLRINNIYANSNAGHGVTANGDIILENLAGTVTYDIIKAGGNADLQAHFTVPNGKRAYIEMWAPSLVSEKKDTFGRIMLRSTTDWSNRTVNLPGVFLYERALVGADSIGPLSVKPHLVFPPKADIKVSAQLLTGTGTMAASVQFMIVIEDL